MSDPLLAIFVAGVLTGFAGAVLARLTPDAIAAIQHIMSYVPRCSKAALNVPLHQK